MDRTEILPFQVENRFVGWKVVGRLMFADKSYKSWCFWIFIIQGTLI